MRGWLPRLLEGLAWPGDRNARSGSITTAVNNCFLAELRSHPIRVMITHWQPPRQFVEEAQAYSILFQQEGEDSKLVILSVSECNRDAK